MAIDEGQLIAHVRDFVRKFVERHYPDEVAYFQLIWQQFSDHQREIATSEQPRGVLLHLGLGLGGQDDLPLATPFALILTHAVFCELNAKGFSPTPTKVQEAVKSCAKQFGATNKTARDVVKSIGPDLCRFFQNPANHLQSSAARVAIEQTDCPSCSKQAPVAEKLVIKSESESARVYVERWDGKTHFTAKDYSIGAAKRLREMRKYDIVVEECAEKALWIEGNPQAQGIQVVPIAKMQRGMLWLLLKHFERKYIEHADIRRLFGVRGEKVQFSSYRVQLGELLRNDLRNRVMPKGRDHKFYILKEGISFFWLRASFDADQSLLRHELPPSQTKP